MRATTKANKREALRVSCHTLTRILALTSSKHKDCSCLQAAGNGIEGDGRGKDGKDRTKEGLDDRLILAPAVVFRLPAKFFLVKAAFDLT